MKNAILNIAKKEIMDNFRNKWILVVTIIFASLTILVSYVGSLGSRWQDIDLTIAGMMTLVQFLIPIIGLMLGYAAIVGEINRGSMDSLLSFPVSRFEILIGKFLGLGTVLSASILVGFGIAGVIIGVNASEVDYIGYLIFIGASILIGLIFLSLALLFSSFFKRRTTSMGMAIFSWFFFTIIWQFIMSLILVSIYSIEEIQQPGYNPADWFYGISLINPLSAYSGLTSLNINTISSSLYPSFYSSGLMILILFVWIIIPLGLAFLLFKRKDI